jgi:hypothetical protein
MIRALVLSAFVLASAGTRSRTTMEHDFTIRNRGHHEIAMVFISAVDRPWEGDLLGDEVLVPTEEHTFAIREGCLEDIRIVYIDGYMETYYAVNTCEVGSLTFRH